MHNNSEDAMRRLGVDLELRDRFLSRAEVARFLGSSISTVQRGEKEGWLPKPVRVAPNMVRHRFSTLMRALTSRDEPAASGQADPTVRRPRGRPRKVRPEIITTQS